MSALHTLEELRSGRLTGIRSLKLACGLTSFPSEIFDLADSLEILDLTGNLLSSLPDDLWRLHKLRILFCSDNLFAELPAVLGSCPELSMIGFKANQIHTVPAASLPPKLRWLTLTDNAITALPEEIGRCGQLQKLMLAGNQLTALPASLAACTNLELLRIAANRLTVLPDWLLSLPRLSWLAYAGNPLSAEREMLALEQADIPAIAWQRLQLGPQLGEGASGVIYQAVFDDNDVAVKLFKGSMTSDGLPRSEMAACVSAGPHDQMIPILGTISGHPQDAMGLVMPLISPEFKNLAGPPSFESCTRDVYAAGLDFSRQQVVALLHGIASATRQLHAHGILHGDLYGHNILHADQGACLLGDFGAASMFVPGAKQAHALQRLETRAFGCLLEELMARCATPLLELEALKQACLQEDAGQRPDFIQIAAVLAQLQRP